MKGLLLKDLYMIKSHHKLYLVLLPIFWVIGSVSKDSSYIILYPCLMTAMVPVSLQMYDEKEHWNIYSRTLPYSPGQLVSVKYLLNLLTILLNLTIILLGQLIRMLCSSGLNMQELLSLLLPGLFISLLPTAFILPIIFKFGAEKAPLAFILLAMIIGAIFAGITMAEHQTGIARRISEILQNPAVFTAIVLTGSVILYGISWMLSIKLYARKECA